MNAQKHTPGPYEYRSDRTIAANGVPVARCYAGRNEVANGSLFAASSELLAALKAMVLNDSHTYRDCHKAALLAIAKAEGAEAHSK